jgi:hypothetical protein
VVQDRDLVQHLSDAGREIAFVPAWFARIESRRQEFGGVVQGDFHVRILYSRFFPRGFLLLLTFLLLKWNGGWPAGDNDINFDTDAYHLQYNPGPLYMASVSPWFFTVSRLVLIGVHRDRYSRAFCTEISITGPTLSTRTLFTVETTGCMRLVGSL